MINYPLVTVNILSYNRKEELRNTIQKVVEQNYKNIEIIVVDNASTDGSAEMAAKEFPEVNLIRLDKNIGIAGWNEGFKAAKGDYVLVLDDDSFPQKDAIQTAISSFKKDSRTGIVAFNIFNTFFNRFEENYTCEIPYSFIGCGALIRMELIKKIGGYSESYFLYHNELDYAARSLNEGYKIKFVKDAIVIHNFNIRNRISIDDNLLISPKRYYYLFISSAIFFIQNFSFFYCIRMLFKLVINRFLIAIKFHYVHEFGKAIKTLITNYGLYKSNRVIIKTGIQKKYLKLISFVDRDFFPDFKSSKIYAFLKFTRLVSH